MSKSTLSAPAPAGQRAGLVQALALLELTKPITWFAPVWAYGCGLVSSGIAFSALGGEHFLTALLGLVLAGPAVCGTSQIVNDWFDRHVDAINQPERPIPSGRVPGQRGLVFAGVWTVLSLLLAFLIGGLAPVAALVGLGFAWAYSAPPLRLKKSGIWGPLAVALCYEGLPWVTAAALVMGGWPSASILLLALLYSLGAHGIMTLNDFKAVTGDRQMGVRSLPVMLGTARAALVACAVMALPQIVVIALLLGWGLSHAALLVALLLTLQALAMRRLVRDPARFAPWYGATGVSLYVLGMLVCALALGGHVAFLAT